MSVNEVKLKKAAEPFVIKGDGPITSRTFCIGDEDHTLGNALRHVLIQNSSVVGFAGYSVPHPSEPVMHIRVQTVSPTADQDDTPTAIDALKTACYTLNEQCGIVLEKLEKLIPEVQEDRIRMEKILLEEGYEEVEDDMDMEGDEVEPMVIKTERK